MTHDPLAIGTGGYLTGVNELGEYALGATSISTARPTAGEPALLDSPPTAQPNPGPYYTAWVDANETTWSATHYRTDLEVFAFEIEHAEGEFATLRLDVRNERVGLLNPSRKQWLWFGHFDGVGTFTPLFFGRIVGVPQELQNEVVRYEFLARPGTYETDKRALAATLRTEERFDPLLIDPLRWDDPDVALESYPAAWHIDRTTHAVTVSDVNQGEDGTLAINGDFFYDSLSITWSQNPVKTARVTCAVSWEQVVNDKRIDISPAFPKLETVTGASLVEQWPEKGDGFGDKWSVHSTSSGVNGEFYNTYTSTVNGLDLTDGGRTFGIQTFGRPYGWDLGDNFLAVATLWELKPAMTVRLDMERFYTETLRFDLTADVQALKTDAGDDEILELSYGGNADELVDPISGGYETAIKNRAGRRYFATARGQRTIKYLMQVARASLCYRARAVEVTAEFPIEAGFSLSCRQDATLVDDRIPGGTCTGKVIAYRLSLDGDSGEQYAEVTIGCTVGQGGTLSLVGGTPVYVESDYVADGWQTNDGATYQVIGGNDDVHFGDISDVQPNDDGIDIPGLSWRDATVQYTNDSSTQVPAADNLTNRNYFTGQVIPPEAFLWELTTTYRTQICVDMPPFEDGPFETDIPLAVTVLKLPKTIDLEAGAI